MPFVTLAGGLTITHDIKKDLKDEKGNTVTEGNGFKPLKLGYGEHCDYNPNSSWFKQIVRRGVPDPKERNWVNGVNPVWRIPTNLFTAKERDEDGNDYEVVDHKTWLRFLEFFELNQSQKDKLVYYEPDIEDIEIKKFGRTAGFHFPTWVLNELVSMGQFKRALTESLINNPSEKKLDDQGYEYLMQEIAHRNNESEDVTLEESNVIAERSKKKGDAARADGRKRQVKEKELLQNDAKFEARKEAIAQKAREILSKDGIVS